MDNKINKFNVEADLKYSFFSEILNLDIYLKKIKRFCPIKEIEIEIYQNKGIYIFGLPGIGKTTFMKVLINKLKSSNKYSFQFINFYE